jgi:hypothetical protein
MTVHQCAQVAPSTEVNADGTTEVNADGAVQA